MDKDSPAARVPPGRAQKQWILRSCCKHSRDKLGAREKHKSWESAAICTWRIKNPSPVQHCAVWVPDSFTPISPHSGAKFPNTDPAHQPPHCSGGLLPGSATFPLPELPGYFPGARWCPKTTGNCIATCTRGDIWHKGLLPNSPSINFISLTEICPLSLQHVWSFETVLSDFVPLFGVCMSSSHPFWGWD